MPAFLKILLLFALLQGCALEVRETAETTQSAQEREQLARAHQEQAQRLWLRAQEFEQQRDFIRSANELISYQAYLDQDADIRANTAKIWGLLNRADRKSLEQRYGADPQALSGWLELAVIKRTLLSDSEALARALVSWQENHPAHPAHSTIIGELRASALLYQKRPGKIALLLPLRGAFREAAEAVRDGFVSAWFNSGPERPPVMIYEANSLNINQVYSKAVTEGAEFIVGPLEKEALTKLSAWPGLSVPTLALNQARIAPDIAANADASILPALIQFSLSPEDEARQVAERASADGRRRALAIVPADEWGQRLRRAFRESWSASGGIILEVTEYDPRTDDYGATIKQLLNVDDSEYRTRRLRQTLVRGLENRARRRQDADMIFMAAFPITGRQLIPQLRFHDAGHIPLYATSHIFTGIVNAQADADMNGVVFPDLPWILAPESEISAIKTLINENFRADSSVYQRLYAFGVDAFNLISQVNRLAYEDEAEFHGATGILSMADDGRIIRKLPWGKIINGKPELLGGN